MDQPRAIHLVRASEPLGEGHAGGTKAGVTISTTMTGGSHGVIVGDTPEGGGPPFHRHATFDETFFILEGRFRFITNDGTIDAAAGDMLFVPGEVPHGFKCLEGGSRGVGRSAIVVTPGRFMGFFEAMEGLAKSGRLDHEELADLGKHWGVEFLKHPSADS